MKYLKVLFIIFSIFLIGCSENKTENEKTEISDDLFITKLQNEKFESDENMYFSLNKFSEKYKIEEKDREFRNAMFYCLFKNKCIGEKKYYLDYIKYLENKETTEKPHIDFNLDDKVETMSTLDKINTKKILRENFEKYFYDKDLEEAFEEYLKISEKKYFKTNIEQELDKLGVFMVIIRELKYKVFYLLKNGQEDEAVKILEKNFNIITKVLDGDSYHIEVAGYIGFLKNSSYLDIILENFDLKEENKEILKNILEIKFNSDEIITNSVKIEYLHLEKILKNKSDNDKDFEKYKNYLKKTYKKILEQKGNFSEEEIEKFDNNHFKYPIFQPNFEPYKNMERFFERLKK